MKLAIIPGFNVLVPQGKLVGGTFKSTPSARSRGRDRLRHDLDQLPREQRPPAGAIFGIADRARHDRRLHQSRRGPARPAGSPLDSYWFARSTLPVPGGPIAGRARARRRRPSAHRRPGLGPLRQRRPARLFLDPHQCRPRATSAPTASAAKSASLRPVHPRLGHAPRRHEPRPGRPHPRGRTGRARR